MALKCNARKLVLNHVSSQFLPIRASFHKYVNQDIRLDWELLDEVSSKFRDVVSTIIR